MILHIKKGYVILENFNNDKSFSLSEMENSNKIKYYFHKGRTKNHLHRMAPITHLIWKKTQKKSNLSAIISQCMVLAFNINSRIQTFVMFERKI